MFNLEKNLYVPVAAPVKKSETPEGPVRTFTKEELAKYDGSDPTLPIYLSIRGRVYDVTAGRSHYGPEGGYHGFAGRDASRSFLDLCFTDVRCDSSSFVR
jgi:predicted heme/steroid binding protein